MMQNDIDTTPMGLVRCLQALAEEAASLSLTSTAAALLRAIKACHAETGMLPVIGMPSIITALLH